MSLVGDKFFERCCGKMKKTLISTINELARKYPIGSIEINEIIMAVALDGMGINGIRKRLNRCLRRLVEK